MMKSLAATALSATIAFTSLGVTPARAADEKAIAALLLGAAAVAVIAKQQRDKRREAAQGVAPQPVPAQRFDQVITPAHGAPQFDRLLDRQPRAARVPESCARRVQLTNGNIRTFFGTPCLRRNGVETARLPQRCERTLSFERRDVVAYGRRCLLNNGVQITS